MGKLTDGGQLKMSSPLRGLSVGCTLHEVEGESGKSRASSQRALCDKEGIQESFRFT